jgi:nitrogen fixation/metabolism regulation signal transduction histidine kinase
MLKLNYEMLRDNALLQMPNAVPGLTREFRMYSLGFIGALILCIVVLFVFGLVMTQRIAGPLIALQRRLKDFADGKEGVRLRLRKDDEFHNLEAIFNMAMEAHDKRTAKARENQNPGSA